MTYEYESRSARHARIQAALERKGWRFSTGPFDPRTGNRSMTAHPPSGAAWTLCRADLLDLEAHVLDIASAQQLLAEERATLTSDAEPLLSPLRDTRPDDELKEAV